MALEKGLDIIGVCDHNSAENIQAVIKATNLVCRGRPYFLTILPGMEICTREEVHIVGIFEKLSDTLKMQDLVYQKLPSGNNNPELFGEQIIANEYDEVEGYNERLLIGASSLSVKEIVAQIHKLNGVAIASHIDREAYSLIGQLGFIPEDLQLDAVEISPCTTSEDVMKKNPGIKKFPILCSSDAHFLQDIGKVTTKFLLAEPTIEEIKMALKDKNGRKIEC